MKDPNAVNLGRKGGLSRSPAKARAARENGKLGGRYMRITKITKAEITHHRDNGQTRASVDWIDEAGHTGTTSGDVDSMHMVALIQRARREGVQVMRDRAE